MSRLHRPKAGFWIRLCVIVLYPLSGVLFRIRFRHLERVPPPESGGVIIAINHISMIDTIVMARLIWQSGRVPRFLIKSSLFHTPGLAWVVHGAEQIPVYRGTSNAAESLKDAVSALDRGEAVIFYPEGTVTSDPDQWPMQAKTGIARLVLLSPKTPVVPVGQWGAQRRPSVPWWRKLNRRTCAASVGLPLDLSDYTGREPNAETLREITDLIMHEVRTQVAEMRNQPAPAHFFQPLHTYVDRIRRKAG
jgi:1-acyl-sn-glycerol-3-phosphate acyltransferase